MSGGLPHTTKIGTVDVDLAAQVVVVVVVYGNPAGRA